MLFGELKKIGAPKLTLNIRKKELTVLDNNKSWQIEQKSI